MIIWKLSLYLNSSIFLYGTPYKNNTVLIWGWIRALIFNLCWLSKILQYLYASVWFYLPSRVSVAWMAVGVTSLGRDQKWLPYKTETVPADSKTDPLQDTIRQAGGISAIIYLRKGKKRLYNSSWSRWMRILKRNNPTETTSRAGVEEGTPCAGSGSPLESL